jgi:hypothetical protein
LKARAYLPVLSRLAGMRSAPEWRPILEQPSDSLPSTCSEDQLVTTCTIRRRATARAVIEGPGPCCSSFVFLQNNRLTDTHIEVSSHKRKLKG